MRANFPPAFGEAPARLRISEVIGFRFALPRHVTTDPARCRAAVRLMEGIEHGQMYLPPNRTEPFPELTALLRYHWTSILLRSLFLILFKTPSATLQFRASPQSVPDPRRGPTQDPYGPEVYRPYARLNHKIYSWDEKSISMKTSGEQGARRAGILATRCLLSRPCLATPASTRPRLTCTRWIRPSVLQESKLLRDCDLLWPRARKMNKG